MCNIKNYCWRISKKKYSQKWEQNGFSRNKKLLKMCVNFEKKFAKRGGGGELPPPRPPPSTTDIVPRPRNTTYFDLPRSGATRKIEGALAGLHPMGNLFLVLRPPHRAHSNPLLEYYNTYFSLFPYR